MQLRHLQHYIMLIMLACALLLSLIFSAVAYHLNQLQAQQESNVLTRNLMATVKASASAAVFSGNETVGRDAINGLLSNDSVYSVVLVGYADELTSGMTLKGNSATGAALAPITMDLPSPFDEQEILGRLIVEPNQQWVDRNAAEGAIEIIIGLIIVIFSSSLITAQIIKSFISKPLVAVMEKLQHIKPGEEERLALPKHLAKNEIGALVDGFNRMLDRVNQDIAIERKLRTDMEEVQHRLEKAKQQAEDATAAKSNFLATMSHEIRTPMNSIIGFLELAIEDPTLEPDTSHHLAIALKSARFLLQLISDILDVSKIESGKQDLELRPFELAELLYEVHDLMEIKSREKKLRFDLLPMPSFPSAYLGDPYKIRQILINLIGNAIKFTHQGSVTLAIKQVANNQFEFSITDTGIGIVSDRIGQILEPFTQGDASITRQFGGTGLGTTISAELLKLMSSKLEIESEFGVGSRFYFTLALETATIDQPQFSPLNSELVHHNNLNILLVDDVEENIVLATTRLINRGHQVTAAFNGKQASELANDNHYDVILMDIQMPQMDGYQATHVIRKPGQLNTNTPIVAMTANVIKGDQSKFKQAGMNAIVTKPIDFKLLFSTIDRLSADDDLITVNTAPLRSHDEPDNDHPLIDINNGIEVWQEQSLFYKTLHRFAADNINLAATLQACYQQSNHWDLLQRLHKLKGTAGNLSLFPLLRAVEHLEGVLARDDEQQCETQLRQLKTTLTATLDNINSLPAIPTKQTSDQVNVIGNIATCREQLRALEDACQQHDPDLAEVAFQALSLTMQGSLLTDLAMSLENFDFANAIQQIKDLDLRLNKET